MERDSGPVMVYKADISMQVEMETSKANIMKKIVLRLISDLDYRFQTLNFELMLE